MNHHDFLNLPLIESSGKLKVVENLLKELHKTGSEKTVLISYYTQTLDIFVKLCNMKHYKYLRLDGTTATAQRTDIVKSFNNVNSDYSKYSFLFFINNLCFEYYKINFFIFRCSFIKC